MFLDLEVMPARTPQLWSTHDNWRGGLFGWVVMSRRGRVAASLGAHELISQIRMKISERRRGREGGSLEGAVARWKYEGGATHCWLAATELQNKTSTPAPFSNHISKYLCHSYSTKSILLLCAARTAQSYNLYNLQPWNGTKYFDSGYLFSNRNILIHLFSLLLF